MTRQLFVPPTEGEFAGQREFESPKRPYDLFMEQEGLPIYREMGFRDVRELELSPWERLGGQGAYVQLLGTEGIWGMYVVEIPPGEALNSERHIYEEIMYVVEGAGSTEVRSHDGGVQQFEWHAGSQFGIPLNAEHRLFNVTEERALLIVGTTAPPVINLFENQSFVFDNPFEFTERFDGSEDYFEYDETLVPDPIRGRAMSTSSLLPDIANMELPLDNQRGPGMKRMQPLMANAKFYMKIMEHQVGRYSKAHYHPASAVLICVRGEGYTLTWPRELGLTPWADGRGDGVRRVDYVPGGIVAAAPGGGDWVHQHFAVGNVPLRVLAMNGPPQANIAGGAAPGVKVKSGNLGISEGGRSIDYWAEDPYIRSEFEAALARNGLTSDMNPSLYIRGE